MTNWGIPQDKKSKVAILQRTSSSDQGTFGEFVCEGYSCFSMELPWRFNKKQISCIPAGTYKCQLFESPKFGRYLYRLEKVPGRTVILIHPANWAGDTHKGFRTQLNGCISLGEKVGTLEGQKALIGSKNAVQKLHDLLKGEQFTLVIRDLVQVSSQA